MQPAEVLLTSSVVSLTFTFCNSTEQYSFILQVFGLANMKQFLPCHSEERGIFELNRKRTL
ncbi:MAG: hypothetical protein JWR72_574 [Flavisolibacter sp.]|jgi:hypothetical protein|nr:hypothetical protein [Flavisolibacter sp.]